jgi:diguanylate cyclase (GGDEF)-like protein
MMENALFESHFDLIPFGIYVVDAASYTVIYSNKAFIERFGDHHGRVCHKALFEIDAPCRHCHMAELLAPGDLPSGATRIFEHFNEADDRWYQMQVRGMTWPDGRVVKYSIGVDISELKEMQNRLAEAHAKLALTNLDLVRLSTTDLLTGLANRQHVDACLAQALAQVAAQGRPLGLIMLDIDHFKAINDRYGHLRGDAVLAALGALLRRGVSEGCGIGRWGGEEFVVLCPGMALDAASRLAEDLRRAARALVVETAGLRVTCSFGVAAARAGDTGETLLARADQALYAAKALGRDRVETEEAHRPSIEDA